MKKVMCVFIFLMMVGGVLAMDDAIRVKTEPGNEVRLAVRLLDGGSLGYNERGIADEDGYWEHTFFSLSREDIKYHVRVLSGLNVLREDVFEGWGIRDPLLIDCNSNPCVISIDTRVVEEVEDLPVVVENGSVVEVADENVSVVVENISVANGDSDSGFTGMAMFMNEDGSIRWMYSLGGGVVILFLVVFIFMMFHHSKKGGDVVSTSGRASRVTVVADEDDMELEEEEKKVEEVAEKIRSLKEKKVKRSKIELARAKLAEEEAELKELGSGGSKAEVEKQEEVVERAEDKVEDAKE